MAVNPIQWFPGHMAKTRRVMRECLPQTDVILEVLDARIPRSSRNPETDALIGDKPRVLVLTKSSLAAPAVTKRWETYYKKKNIPVTTFDSLTSDGYSALTACVREVLSEKIDRYRERGMEGRRLRAMVVGIPNVGKSSLINRLAGTRVAKVENRPGVTLQKQWIPTAIGFDLLDMPGVLWPKFDDETVGQNLALTGAIRDQILDTEELAMVLCDRLRAMAPEAFAARYRLVNGEWEDLDAYDLFCLVGKKRGFLLGGGHINEERTAHMLLEEFRAGTVGRISLEEPEV